MKDINERPIVMSKATCDKLLKQKEAMNLIGLYVFYYYTAIWQKTNQPKCTISFAAKGLGVSEERIRRYKKALIGLGLIEDETIKKNGKIVKHHIRVNYYSNENSQCTGFPDSGKCQTVVNHKVNAYRPNSKTAVTSTASSFGKTTKNKSYATICATQLAEAVLLHLKVNYKDSIPSWAKEFHKLENNMGVDRLRINNTLTWFCDSLAKKRISHAFSGYHFRMKYVYIEQAMLKSTPRNNKVSKEADKVYKSLSNLSWPKGCDRLLPGAIEMSLRNYTAFLNQHSILIKSLRGTTDKKKKKIYHFAKKKVDTELTAPNTFIRKWFESAHEQVSNWSGWSGSLDYYVFSKDSKLLRCMGTDWAESYSQDGSKWDRYMEALDAE